MVFFCCFFSQKIVTEEAGAEIADHLKLGILGLY